MSWELRKSDNVLFKKDFSFFLLIIDCELLEHNEQILYYEIRLHRPGNTNETRLWNLFQSLLERWRSQLHAPRLSGRPFA